MEFENEIFCGDNMKVMVGLEANSIDTIITDPPYGLGFMGKEWDTFKGDDLQKKRTVDKNRKPRTDGRKSVAWNNAGDAGSYDHSRNAEFQQWFTLWAKECLRIAKPGAMMLVFGGTRTFHRLTCAIEDAGWQIRDCIMWLYGSGFPKSHDISKAIDKANRRFFVDLSELQDRLNQRRLEKGLTLKDMNRLFGVADNSGCAAHKFCDKTQPQFPTRQQMTILEDVLELNGEFGEELWGLYEEIEREVIGKGKAGLTKGNICTFAGTEEFDITAPATDLAKQWDGYGTALKPAWEPIIVAMKPLDGTFAQNAEKWGVGGLWIDGGRIGINPEVDASQIRTMNRSQKTEKNGWGMNQNNADKPQVVNPQGRWPANIILDEESSLLLDEQSGNLMGGTGKTKVYGEYHNDKRFNASKQVNRLSYKGSGGASRFFYCAKASRSERNAGLEGMEAKNPTTYSNESAEGAASRGRKPRHNTATANNHPTVKPLKLMEYLCRLTRTPAGGIVLDPFGGSGTTAVACRNTGRKYILIEKDPHYCEIARARTKQATLFQ